MTDTVTVTREQAAELFRAIHGIGELLKALPSRPENASVTYGIMSNLAVIRTALAGMPRFDPN